MCTFILLDSRPLRASSVSELCTPSSKLAAYSFRLFIHWQHEGITEFNVTVGSIPPCFLSKTRL